MVTLKDVVQILLTQKIRAFLSHIFYQKFKKRSQIVENECKYFKNIHVIFNFRETK